ncbi:MAG: Gldg family protein [Gemmatimonadetes bacterium]|nr:Gldg family protein [Gemmatimonadota bacterium]
MSRFVRQVLLVARRELKGFFDQPTAYVLAVAFLGLSLYLSLRTIYALGAGTLRPYFDLLPWLLVVFMPAVTMRSLAEERRGRTLEWLMAQPVSETVVVLGKFLGSWLFVMITMLGTLPMAVGVLTASGADVGIAVAQYLGAALLVAQMLAIGIWASSITRNQITAFIIGGFVALFLVLVGYPVVQIALPRLVGGWLIQLSVVSHFDNVGRGVIDLRDLLYFVTMTGVFLLFAVAALSRERLSRSGDAFRRLRIGTAAIAAAVLVLNLLGSYVRGRLDLTEDRLFTISEGSRDILEGLDDIVNLTVFLSDDLPQEIQLVVRDVRDLVADLREASGGMLAVHMVNPDDGPDQERQASEMNVMPIEFNVIGDDEYQVKRGYFGLAVSYADELETVPVVRSADDLEFRLVSGIAKMTADTRPSLAFLTGFGAGEPGDGEMTTFVDAVSDRYDVTTIDLGGDSAVALDASSIDVAVLVGPDQLSEDAAGALDGYLNDGGAALLLVERHSYFPRPPMTTPRESGLEDLLAERGIEVTGEMVFDNASPQRVAIRRGRFNVHQPYPLWPLASRGASHATNSDLQNVGLAWASTFVWDEDDPAVTPLWTTSAGGGTREPGLSIEPGQPFGEDAGELGELGVHTMAVAYDPSLAAVSGGDAEEVVADSGGEGAQGRGGGRLVAVADADLILDRIVTRGHAHNVTFAANAVDWLVQDEALISIRSKNRTPPPLVFESDGDRAALRWVSLIGVPALFVIVGVARVTGRGKRARRRWRDDSQETEASAE